MKSTTAVPGTIKCNYTIRCGRVSTMDGDGYCSSEKMINGDLIVDWKDVKSSFTRLGWQEIRPKGRGKPTWICPDCVQFYKNQDREVPL